MSGFLIISAKNLMEEYCRNLSFLGDIKWDETIVKSDLADWLEQDVSSDIVIITDDVIDGFKSRKQVSDFFLQIRQKNPSCYIIALSCWSDTDGDSKLILVSRGESIQEKCEKITEAVVSIEIEDVNKEFKQMVLSSQTF